MFLWLMFLVAPSQQGLHPRVIVVWSNHFKNRCVLWQSHSLFLWGLRRGVFVLESVSMDKWRLSAVCANLCPLLHRRRSRNSWLRQMTTKTTKIKLFFYHVKKCSEGWLKVNNLINFSFNAYTSTGSLLTSSFKAPFQAQSDNCMVLAHIRPTSTGGLSHNCENKFHASK